MELVGHFCVKAIVLFREGNSTYSNQPIQPVMSGSYTEITEREMDELLIEDMGFRKAASFGEGAKEKVYDFAFDTKGGGRLALVVFSSISMETGTSRGCGNDAIRVVLMWRDDKSSTEEWKAVGSTKRVNRIGTWRKNLRKRISNWRNMLEGTCSKCGAPLKVRSSRNGKFLGCTRYEDTGCEYTESYDG